MPELYLHELKEPSFHWRTSHCHRRICLVSTVHVAAISSPSGDAEVYSLFVVSILIVNANAPFILKDEKIVDSSLLEAHSTAC